jgi:hypothetical protein
MDALLVTLESQVDLEDFDLPAMQSSTSNPGDLYFKIVHLDAPFSPSLAILL